MHAAYEQLIRWALSEVPQAERLLPRVAHPELSELRGDLRGTPCTMRTRTFSGTVWQRWLVAVIRTDDGQPASLTVIGFPSAASSPIIGIDLIGFGGRLPLVAVDALAVSGSTPELRERCSRALQQLRQQLDALVVDRRRPEFATAGFSPDALIVGTRPGNEEKVMSVLANALPDLFAAVCSGSKTTQPCGSCHAAITHWIAAERENRKEHSALARIFGDDAASRYLREVLLPDDVEQSLR